MPSAPRGRPSRPTIDGHDEAEPEHNLRLEGDAVFRPVNEVLLQEIVGDGRLGVDARKQGIEGRRHHFAHGERRRADENHLVFDGLGTRVAAQHVRRRDRGKGAFWAPIAQQQIALAVKRHAAAAESQ